MPDGNWWDPTNWGKDIQTAATDAEHTLTTAADWAKHAVEKLGIPWFPEIEFIAQLFLDAGENVPGAFWKIYQCTRRLGLDFAIVMSQLAEDIQRYGGPGPCLRHILEVALDPIPSIVRAGAQGLMNLATTHADAFAAIDRFLEQHPGFDPFTDPTMSAGVPASQTASSGRLQRSYNLNYARARANVATLAGPLNPSVRASLASTASASVSSDDGYQPTLDEITADFERKWTTRFEQVKYAWAAFEIVDIIILVLEIEAVIAASATAGVLTIEVAGLGAIPVAVGSGEGFVAVDVLLIGGELEALGLLPILTEYLLRLIGLLLYAIHHAIAPATTTTTTHHYAPALPLPPGATPKELDDLAEQWRQIGVKAVSTVYTAYHYISWLLCHQYGPDDIAALGDVFNRLDAASPDGISIEEVFARAIGGGGTDQVGMVRLLKAIMLIGPTNVTAIDLNYTDILGSTDADIITRQGDVYEVGGSSKGGSSARGIDTGHYSRQLMHAQMLATSFHGTAYTMLEIPSNPAQMVYFDQAVATADSVLGPGHVRYLPPDQHTSICPGVA